MEAIIFIGIQGSGKSSFYKKHFFHTHIRINLDMLKTRHREQMFVQTCLETNQRFVVDNTNPTVEDRLHYIQPAKAKQFKIVGYYFPPDLEGCKGRNNRRHGKQMIPLVGLLATYKKLIPPTYQEGFDELYSVKIGTNYSFIVEQWQDEI